MYGLAAINANNGWAISVVGISIVFTGLVVLSLVISQLHKVLDFYENPQKIKEFFAPKPAPESEVEEAPKEPLSKSRKEAVRQFEMLAQTLDDHFSLPRLLHLAETRGVDHPHSHLNFLLKTGVIRPDKDGYHTWDSQRFDTIISD